MPAALVTGGAGFVGAALVDALLRRGDDVCAVVHPRTPTWRLSGADGCRLALLDLHDVEGVAGVLRSVRPTRVFHAAAAGGHPHTAPGRQQAWHDTVGATAALWEAVEVAAVDVERVLHVGSSLEYRPSGRPLAESDPIEPRTPRGAAKAAAGILARQRGSELGVPTTIARVFSAYGPREQPDRVIPTLLRAARDGTPFSVTPTARDFVHVDDVAEACALLAQHPAAAGESCNVGTGRSTSIGELVRTLEAVIGHRIQVDEDRRPARPVDVPHWQADTTKAEREFGWRAAIGLADGLAALAAAGTVVS